MGISKNTIRFAMMAAVVSSCGARALAQEDQSTTDAPTGSLLVRAARDDTTPAGTEPEHELQATSMFAVAPPELRKYRKHDLVQIVVRETSQAKSSQELETDKEFNLNGKVTAWPNLELAKLLELQLEAGRTTNLPAVKLDFSKEFTGEGDYARKDDLTARLTAEVIEVLPNGNLVLEARTFIKTDEEEATMKVTGICRPDDITAANTILSNQIHDLAIEKMHEGELKKTSEKGIIARVLETIFAF